ncbi:MAG: HD domain-containing protein [Candidatus Woesearchaeota archaeon]
MIPTKQECLQIFNKYILLSNVKQHCLAVTSVATYIAQKVKEQKSPNLNLNIVFATSLFHDLGKAGTITKLEPEKYGFKPLNEEELNVWKELRALAQSLNKEKVHETEITKLILEPLFPDFIPYLNQIGGTRNDIYYSAGMEIKIMHYADWILHKHNLIAFEKRLNYLFKTYGEDFSEEEWKIRKEKEFLLEKNIFDGLNVTPEFDLSELNKLKEELFGELADFEIGKVEDIN